MKPIRTCVRRFPLSQQISATPIRTAYENKQIFKTEPQSNYVENTFRNAESTPKTGLNFLRQGEMKLISSLAVEDSYGRDIAYLDSRAFVLPELFQWGNLI